MNPGLRLPRVGRVVIATMACGCIGRSVPVESPAAAPLGEVHPLREAAAAAHRHIGAALMSRHLGNASLVTVVATHFDSLTPENEMKWQATEPRPGQFTLAAGDKLVAFAQAHDMRVRGHTLVWHQQLADWVTGLSGEALREAMRRHIRGLVGHWRGRIGQWDVVNEALADDGRGLRDSPFLSLGENYLDEAFRAAHAADPDAQLFYNDYEIEAGQGNPKSDAAYRLVKRMRDTGVPIHGIGLQMHVDPRHWPSAEQIRRNVERFVAQGLVVEFTELDVPVGQLRGSHAEKLQQQRSIAHDIVAACLAVEGCTGITLWGASDRNSWLASPAWAHLRGQGPHYPLAFDSDLRPKPMFFGIADAFAGR